MSDSFNVGAEAECIENAVSAVLDAGYRTADIMDEDGMLLGTREMGDKVVEMMKK